MSSDWTTVNEINHLDALEWQFFYGTRRPTQYGFLPSNNDNSSKSAPARPAEPAKKAAPPKLQRSDSSISDHLDKTVDIEVPLCCEACGTRIMDTLIDLEGVTSVAVDYNEGKVTLRGEVSPKEALKIIKKLKPKATHRVHAKKVTYSKTTAPAPAPANKSKK